MIARVWHGATTEAVADEFQDYIFATGLSGLKSTPGNAGVMLLRRAEKGKEHFLLVSFWESFAAISRFAGLEVKKARYYPEDEKYLITMEPNVAHYEVVASPKMVFDDDK